MKFLLKIFNPHLSFLVFVLGLSITFSLPVSAQGSFQEHIFSVYGIEVDVTAQNAREARSQALSKAQVEAFNLLLRKISLEDRLAEARKLTSFEITNHVSGIEVHNERTSARRYIATLDISFNKAKVLQYLGMNNLPYTELTGGPLLLLPVYNFGGVSSLFEGENPWREAINNSSFENHLYKFIQPIGDFKDRLQVGNPEVLQVNLRENNARVRDLNLKYGTSDVLIVQARWGEVTENGLKNLHFSYFRGLSPTVKRGVIFATESLSQEEMFKKAASAIFSRLDISWREQTLTSFGAFNELRVKIPAQTAEQWVDMVERLEATPIVRSIKIEKMAIPVSEVTIVYSGVLEQLKLVLEGVNINMVEYYDGWQLERTSQ